MRVYKCDFCNRFMENPFERVYMRELKLNDKPFKKRKIHICEKCWLQIAMKSQESGETK